MDKDWLAAIDTERFAPLRPGLLHMTVAIGVKMLGEDGKRFADRQGELILHWIDCLRWKAEHDQWKEKVRYSEAPKGLLDPCFVPPPIEPERPLPPKVFRDFFNTLRLKCRTGIDEIRLGQVVWPLARPDCPVEVCAIRVEDGLAHSLASILPNEDARRQAIDRGYHISTSALPNLKGGYALAISREAFEYVLATGDINQATRERLGEQASTERVIEKRGNPGGRPEEYPWPEIIDVVGHRFFDLGVPDRTNDERDDLGNLCWRTKAHVVQFIQDYCFKSQTINCDQPNRPSEKTILRRWPDFLRRAEELRRDEIARLEAEGGA